MTNSKINEEKMDRFIARFNDEIFPTIAGEDGASVSDFKVLLDRKRQEVESRRNKIKEKEFDTPNSDSE